MPRSEVISRYPDIYRLWETQPERVQIPGAETLQVVRGRLIRGLDATLGHNPDGTVALVSHGLTNKVLLCAVLGLDNSHFWKIKQDVCAVNVFQVEDKIARAMLLNDTCHLARLAIN